MGENSTQISHAFWKSKNTGLIILSKDWESAKGRPPLFFGRQGSLFATLDRLDPSEAGRYCRYFRRKNSWVFTIQSKRYTQLTSVDRPKVYLAGDFNGWADAIGKPAWQLKPIEDEIDTTFELRVPLKKIPADQRAQFKFVTEGGEWLDVPDSAPNRVSPQGVNNFEFHGEQSGKHIFRFTLAPDFEPVGNECIVWRKGDSVEIRDLPHTQFLLSAQTKLPMGATVEGDQTTFRLFAPRADGVRVCYGKNSDSSDVTYRRMHKVEPSTWEITIDQNLDGWYYTYRVEGHTLEGTSHFDGMFEVMDPYAKACLGFRGPGVVVAPGRMPRISEPFEAPSWHDLVIMEGHVRDFAAHAPIDLNEQERKGYSGLRKWLKAEGSYIKEMGVNAVELQPIQEFDNRHPDDYHWGYMTVNYFAPESSYALEPDKASQIEEFRGLVQDFHDEGIAVILDVVYNHVGEPNHLLFIDKYYYFHLDDANDLVNWSGCGNDLRCDTPMGRRLIIESLKHLVEVYDVDGFRFDLAELIGIEVLREVEIELKKVKPSIILIAEPWSFRGHIQDELRETGFASWNDGFREAIAKYVKGDGNQDMIQYFLSGSPGTSRFVAQTINYTESHDDHCWLDRITERTGYNGSEPTLVDRRRTQLMASILFASLGVPMLAAGQDFLRSKNGVENTYQRGDLNALDYNKRLVSVGTHSYFREWIHFRLSDLGRALRYDGGLQDGYLKAFVADGFSAVVMVYNVDQSIDAPQLIFGVNPHHEYANIECEGVALDQATQIADVERFQVDGLEHALIPINGDTISLPPLSCGLWVVRKP